jgi:hypothetical protein
MAAGSRNIARAAILSRILNGMIERGRGPIFVPVDAMVSVLDTTLCRAGAHDERHLPGMITLFFKSGEQFQAVCREAKKAAPLRGSMEGALGL